MRHATLARPATFARRLREIDPSHIAAVTKYTPPDLSATRNIDLDPIIDTFLSTIYCRH